MGVRFFCLSVLSKQNLFLCGAKNHCSEAVFLWESLCYVTPVGRICLHSNRTRTPPCPFAWDEVFAWSYPTNLIGEFTSSTALNQEAFVHF